MGHGDSQMLDGPLNLDPVQRRVGTAQVVYPDIPGIKHKKLLINNMGVSEYLEVS